MLGTLIERQNNSTMVHGLSQKISINKHKVNYKDLNNSDNEAEEFEIDEDNWSFFSGQIEHSKTQQARDKFSARTVIKEGHL